MTRCIDMSSDEFKNSHIRDLLIWLEKEVLSAGGDGDAFWITEYYSIEEILPIVDNLNSSIWSNHWKIDVKENSITMNNLQEGFVITTDKNYGIPSWAQCVITC